jgi:hypothetical protein
MNKRDFKIGRSLFYHKGGTKGNGRDVVLAVLPQPPGEVCYRIRSQDDESVEHVARESELNTV